MRIILALLLAATSGAAAADAWAPYSDVFFVKRDGTGAQMLEARRRCSSVALNQGDGGEGYSDPRYGPLIAMSANLDSAALHGGQGKKLRRAILEACMQQDGWIQLDPAPTDLKPLMKASPQKPRALDEWLKAHAPAPAPVPPTGAAPSPPG